ncbi:hypothetical protein H5410_057947 [Solanum commersonii]|uniref:Uncharacterized protein n=1 Tax=Solanum commersonii TaxID=4109 RepID=A0A9J5WR77_SOLCO|nr:hypothetical protein H5410_057947 [Solanum commersonii]
MALVISEKKKASTSQPYPGLPTECQLKHVEPQGNFGNQEEQQGNSGNQEEHQGNSGNQEEQQGNSGNQEEQSIIRTYPDFPPGFPNYPTVPPGFPNYPAALPGFPNYPDVPPGFPNYPGAPPGFQNYPAAPHVSVDIQSNASDDNNDNSNHMLPIQTNAFRSSFEQSCGGANNGCSIYLIKGRTLSMNYEEKNE